MSHFEPAVPAFQWWPKSGRRPAALRTITTKRRRLFMATRRVRHRGPGVGQDAQAR